MGLKNLYKSTKIVEFFFNKCFGKRFVNFPFENLYYKGLFCLSFCVCFIKQWRYFYKLGTNHFKVIPIIISFQLKFN